ncbi:MAG TPA: GAF and ANTAR domain-containing protein [Nocardioidaceae bacterium]|nr:GAF and ANTAR domain-containing protein [Nocardioidaceae bacterium]
MTENNRRTAQGRIPGRRPAYDRERRLTKVFVELADTMVDEFDVIDLLHTLAERTVSLLDADAAGIILSDQRGRLTVVAATSHEAELLELFEIQNAEGPCHDCFITGQTIVNVDLEAGPSPWPNFQVASQEAGYRSVHALPLRLRNQVIGAMNLFCAEPVTLSEDDVALGQALADVATIGLLQERAVRQKELLAEQLQTALNSRILIEQAKGALAERAGLDVDDAFRRMRAYSRRMRSPIGEVALAVIEGSLAIDVLQDAGEEPRPGDG